MALRKIHRELGRKGRDVIRLGPVPREKTPEEKGDYAALPAKPWAHEDYAGMLPHGDTTWKSIIVNYFMNFIETVKVMQNEKREESVSI